DASATRASAAARASGGASAGAHAAAPGTAPAPSGSAAPLLEEARRHLARGEWEQALSMLQVARTQYPDDADVAYLLATVSLETTAGSRASRPHSSRRARTPRSGAIPIS